jgi:hypothetical protein
MDLFPGPFRHLTSDVVSDLMTTSILVAVAAVIAFRLLDHMGCSLSDGGQRRYPPLICSDPPVHAWLRHVDAKHRRGVAYPGAFCVRKRTPRTPLSQGGGLWTVPS